MTQLHKSFKIQNFTSYGSYICCQLDMQLASQMKASEQHTKLYTTVIDLTVIMQVGDTVDIISGPDGGVYEVMIRDNHCFIPEVIIWVWLANEMQRVHKHCTCISYIAIVICVGIQIANYSQPVSGGNVYDTF